MSEFLSDKEKAAIKKVCKLGKAWGFGNMIDRLRVAWAIDMAEKHGVSIRVAWETAGLNPNRIKNMDRTDAMTFCKRYTAS